MERHSTSKDGSSDAHAKVDAVVIASPRGGDDGAAGTALGGMSAGATASRDSLRGVEGAYLRAVSQMGDSAAGRARLRSGATVEPGSSLLQQLIAECKVFSEGAMLAQLEAIGQSYADRKVRALARPSPSPLLGRSGLTQRGGRVLWPRAQLEGESEQLKQLGQELSAVIGADSLGIALHRAYDKHLVQGGGAAPATWGASHDVDGK